MKICKYKGCQNKYYSKGYCRNHYRKYNKETSIYWNKLKNDPIRFKRRKLLQRKWEREHKRDYRKHSDKIYFGGFREITIQRDKEKCVDCGVTRAEHVSTWGIDLHVNHIDHTKRNSLDNLETLCIRCHASKSHY